MSPASVMLLNFRCVPWSRMLHRDALLYWRMWVVSSEWWV